MSKLLNLGALRTRMRAALRALDTDPENPSLAETLRKDAESYWDVQDALPTRYFEEYEPTYYTYRWKYERGQMYWWDNNDGDRRWVPAGRGAKKDETPEQLLARCPKAYECDDQWRRIEPPTLVLESDG